jgi:hypothetical protein
VMEGLEVLMQAPSADNPQAGTLERSRARVLIRPAQELFGTAVFSVVLPLFTHNGRRQMAGFLQGMG